MPAPVPRVSTVSFAMAWDGRWKDARTRDGRETPVSPQPRAAQGLAPPLPAAQLTRPAPYADGLSWARRLRPGAARSRRLKGRRPGTSCLDRAKRGELAGWGKWRAVGRESQALRSAHFVLIRSSSLWLRFSNLITHRDSARKGTEGREGCDWNP